MWCAAPRRSRDNEMRERFWMAGGLRMKRFSVVLVVIVLIGSVGVGLTKPTAVDPAMNAYWDKFKAAVIKGDKETVFAMSALPISMEYSLPKIKTKAQFL